MLHVPMTTSRYGEGGTSMDDRTKELFARQKEAEIREHEAKLRRLDAEARATQAQEAIEEISGLHALHDRIKERWINSKSRRRPEQTRRALDIETGWANFQRRFKDAQQKYRAFDDARLERLNARLDQLDAKFDELKAQAKQDTTGEAIAIRGAIDNLKAKLAAAREKRRRVASAKDEAAADVEIAYAQAVDDLNEAYERASEKVRQRHAR